MQNYSEVLDQLRAHGLQVLNLEIGKLVRCRIEHGREKKGWYCLHEIEQSGSDRVLVGTYGIWEGDDNGLQKIVLDKKYALSDEQQAAYRKRITEDKRIADAVRKKDQEIAARHADSAWRKGSADGHIDYLDKKNIQAYGVRFTEEGRMMVPMLDVSGKIHGLQFILDSKKNSDQIKKTGRNKSYWPKGLSKKGHFHLIGLPIDILLIAEGYATAASLHAATGLPVAVAFDANNILPVTEELKNHYKGIKIIICADDDAFARCQHCKKPVNVNQSLDCPDCKKPHLKKNTGVEVASLVAMQLGCHWVKPEFDDQDARFEHYCKNKGKLTDFNDLHLTDGLHTVRVVIDKSIDQFELRSAMKPRGQIEQGGGDSVFIQPFNTFVELLERFSLIYGSSATVFDHQEHCRVTLSDMRDACQRRDIHRNWQESPLRKIVRAKNVGFDPAGTDPDIICNLWAGWPTLPKPGKCEVLLDLLQYMCNEQGSEELYQWVLKWLAYPIQNPGAKMRSTVVIHGPQGTGKNLFFEVIMLIYGEYGRIIDQAAIEDKFNDWASKKLFLIADEVVARTDLYHIKNKLKSFITGEWIRINPKNMGAYEERNHVNMVFLSNERMPVVLEEDDRRHTVIWTPQKLRPCFYKEVAAEIEQGGVAALHDFLLNLPLGDFNEHTKPLMNQAKQELINLGKDNILRFYDEWCSGEIDGMKLQPVLSVDLYELYRAWATRQGVRAATLHKMVDTIAKRPGVDKQRKRYMNGVAQVNPKAFLFPPGGIEMPPGNSETAWLGDCVSDFREGISVFKESEYN